MDPEKTLDLAVASDQRTQRAWDLCQSPGVVALSLDVFDTLLFRAVPEPQEAFVLLGRRLLDTGLLPSTFSPVAFANLRVEAEVRARAMARVTRGSSECRLDEIYSMMQEALPAHDLADFVANETQLEYDTIRVDLAVAALAQLVSQRLGKAVRLVSDTYFSTVQIRHLLARSELSGVSVDHIAVSSEYGTGKAEELFQVSLSTSGINPRSVVHLGDNSVADVEGARRAGVVAVHYEKGTEELTAAMAAEGVLGSVIGDRRVVDPYRGDHGLTALRSRAVRLTEGQRAAEPVRPYWAAGAGIFGPAFAGYAAWVHQRAAAIGADTVFCLMREGEFLSGLINDARSAAEAPVSARPLWLSRQVCSLASIHTGSTEELRSFLIRRKPTSVAGFFRQTGLDAGLLPHVGNLHEASLDVPEVMQTLLAALNEVPESRAQIVFKAGEVRAALYEHLDRELPADGPVVFADVGWGGTIQSLVANLLEARGTPRDLTGLYLATQAHANSKRLDGLRIEGFLADAGEPSDLLQPLLRSPELIEQICMSDSGTLVGFAGDGTTVHGQGRMPRHQVAQKIAVQNGIHAFLDLWLAYRAEAPTLLDLTDLSARPQLLNMITRLVSRPTPQEALLFGSWQHDENFGADHADPLLDAQTLEAVRYLDPAGISALTMRECYWPAAAAALANPAAAPMVDMLARNHLRSTDLVAEESSSVFEFYIDEGHDFHNGPKDVVPVTVVDDGRLLLVSRQRCAGALRVRIDPPGRHSMLRLDRLTISVVTDGGEELVLLDTRTFDEPGLAVVGAHWIAPTVLDVNDSDPMIGFVLPADPPPGSIRMVSVRLLCARLALPAAPLQGIDRVIEVHIPAPPLPRPLWRRSASAALRLSRRVANRLDGSEEVR